MGELERLQQQLDELAESLKARRNDTERLLESNRRELELLDKALEAFAATREFYSRQRSLLAQLDNAVSASTSTPRVESGHNRQVITNILLKYGRPMRAVEIAKIAHEQDTIKSKRGYPGVYSTVQTVLFRNNKRIYTNTNGQWDLRVRPRPLTHKTPPPPPVLTLPEIPEVKGGNPFGGFLSSESPTSNK